MKKLLLLVLLCAVTFTLNVYGLDLNNQDQVIERIDFDDEDLPDFVNIDFDDEDLPDFVNIDFDDEDLPDFVNIDFDDEDLPEVVNI